MEKSLLQSRCLKDSYMDSPGATWELAENYLPTAPATFFSSWAAAAAPTAFSFLGSGPDRGRSPVEWGDFPPVRSSPPLAWMAGPQAWPEGLRPGWIFSNLGFFQFVFYATYIYLRIPRYNMEYTRKSNEIFNKKYISYSKMIIILTDCNPMIQAFW